MSSTDQTHSRTDSITERMSIISISTDSSSHSMSTSPGRDSSRSGSSDSIKSLREKIALQVIPEEAKEEAITEFKKKKIKKENGLKDVKLKKTYSLALPIALPIA